MCLMWIFLLSFSIIQIILTRLRFLCTLNINIKGITHIKQQIMSSQNQIQGKKLSSDNPLFKEVSWITKKVDYRSLSIPQLQDQNHHILITLKLIENRLSKELQQKKIADLATSKAVVPQNIKALDEKIKNNEKYIQVLKRDSMLVENRKNSLNQGLQSKAIDMKFALQKKLQKMKNQLKLMKLQEHETQKRLVAHGGNSSKPQFLQEHQRMQEQLRCYSIKYVRLLDKFNKSSQKLAIVAKTQIPDLQIPQDIYDKQLQERQENQFKEYQGIVKLCKVLSHRNDSQHNKAHREYTLKLRELEKVIMKLGQLDQVITTREGQLMESKKNIQLSKIKMENDERYDSKVMRLSQNSIPRSYSNAGLPTTDRIKKRGSSFTKLPLAH